MRSKILKEIGKIPTASLSDALDNLGIRGFMDCAIKSQVGDVKLAGFAITVKDVLSEKKIAPIEALEAIEKAQRGDVFVRSIEDASKEEASNIALFGGIMALGSKMKGLAGAIIDGGVRDVIEYKEIGFPVFSRSVVPSTSVGRTEVVGVNVPINCGGVIVNPGDLIVADSDGVVVIPKEKLEAVIEAAKRIDEFEKRVVEELERGTSLRESVKKYSRI